MFQVSQNILPYRWTWASATARNAQSVSAADVGAIGFQTDIGLRYLLVSQSGGVGVWYDLPDPSMDVERTVLPVLNASAPNTSGLSWQASGGTATSLTASGTSKYTALPRLEYKSSASAGNQGAARSAVSGAHRVGTVPTRYEFTFGLEETSTNCRWFCGVSTNALGAAVIDPVAITNIIGIGRSGSGDSQVQLYNNDGSGNGDKTALGASFPANNAGTGWRLQLWTVDGSSWGWAVRVLNTGAEISGTVSGSNVPPAGVYLQNLYSTNDTDAASVGVSLCHLRVWTGK